MYVQVSNVNVMNSSLTESVIRICSFFHQWFFSPKKFKWNI